MTELRSLGCRGRVYPLLVLALFSGAERIVLTAQNIGVVQTDQRLVGMVGHDVCAVMVRVDATVTDDQKRPISGVEVWDLSNPLPRPTSAPKRRLGKTDADGRLVQLTCPIQGGDFSTWNPQTQPFSIRLMFVHEDYEVHNVVFTPDPDALLKEGKVLGLLYPDWKDRAYRFPLEVSVSSAKGQK